MFRRRHSRKGVRKRKVIRKLGCLGVERNKQSHDVEYEEPCIVEDLESSGVVTIR